jgi:hypothetical protein
MPLVHTLNPDFWGDVFDLAPSWSPNLLFMKVTAHCGSRIKTSPDSRFQNFADSWFQNFIDFNHPKIDYRFTHRSQIRLLFSHITWRSEKHLRLIRISSWTFPFHETELFIPQVTHEFWQIQHFEGVRFLPNSPTLAPRGSGLTPTIWFHENSRNLVKSVTLGTSEWTHVTRKNLNGRIEPFLETTPLTPINRALAL